jgi:ferrochelatase
MKRTGVLLINLGTPDDAKPRAVYRYLREFLNDPRVIDLPFLLRFMLTHFIIVPFRYKKSTRAYQTIWTPSGSPLLTNSLTLKNALATSLGNDYQVELAMRYGNPSVKRALKELQGCNKLILLPLFPQYSSAATGSAIEKCLNTLKTQWNIPSFYVQNDFYNHPGFIDAYVELIRKTIGDKQPELILFSYHGLPERHIEKSICNAKCDRIAACPAITPHNLYCYRAQCFATTYLIADALQLTPSQYKVTFQSRLGRTPWIKPYTDKVLETLREKGVKNIAIVCPSFVADCLETLEEIDVNARAQWQALGGNEFTFIPCLNNEPLWVKALSDMCQSFA